MKWPGRFCLLGSHLELLGMGPVSVLLDCDGMWSKLSRCSCGGKQQSCRCSHQCAMHHVALELSATTALYVTLLTIPQGQQPELPTLLLNSDASACGSSVRWCCLFLMAQVAQLCGQVLPRYQHRRKFTAVYEASRVALLVELVAQANPLKKAALRAAILLPTPQLALLAQSD